MEHFIWHSSSWHLYPLTLWTAALVHLSWAHFLGNCVALAALLAIAWRFGAVATRRFGLGLLLVWPLSTLFLVFSPLVTYYAGASGVVHGGVALLGFLLIRSAPRNLVGWILLAGLAAKLYLEQAWVQPIVPSQAWGFDVVVIAHLYGAGVGLLVGAVLATFGFRRPLESA